MLFIGQSPGIRRFVFMITRVMLSGSQEIATANRVVPLSGKPAENGLSLISLALAGTQLLTEYID